MKKQSVFFSVSSLCVLLGSGCASAVQPEPVVLPLPWAFVSNTGDTLRFGQPIPGWAAGTRIVDCPDLHLPDGAIQVFIEVNEDGETLLFEFMYPPERSFARVVRYYEEALGPSTEYYERVAGQCVVWEDADTRFEVCKAREPADNGYGQVIAHLGPRPSL